MTTVFPGAKDTFVNPAGTDDVSVVKHSSQHDNINDAMKAVQTKIGVDGSAVITSLDYLLKSGSSVDPGHHHSTNSLTPPGSDQYVILNISGMFSSSSDLQFDYNNAVLDLNGTLSAQYGVFSNYLSDTGNQASIDLNQRILYDENGAEAAHWHTSGGPGPCLTTPAVVFPYNTPGNYFGSFYFTDGVSHTTWGQVNPGSGDFMFVYSDRIGQIVTLDCSSANGGLQLSGGIKAFNDSWASVQSANAFCVGRNTQTNPAFRVDTSAASSVTGLLVTSLAAAAGVKLSAISSGSAEAFTISSLLTGLMTLKGGDAVAGSTNAAGGYVTISGGQSTGNNTGWINLVVYGGSSTGTANASSSTAQIQTIIGQPGSWWLNMPTTGPAGIGDGGAGQNTWIARANATAQFWNDAVAGDICYRAPLGNSLRFGVAASTAIDSQFILALGNINVHTCHLKIDTVNKGLYIKQGTGGFAGKATLVAGTVAVTISGLTTSDEAFVSIVTPAGTLSSGLKAVCTANTLTITSVNTAGATNTLDTSTVRYVIIGAA